MIASDKKNENLKFNTPQGLYFIMNILLLSRDFII